MRPISCLLWLATKKMYRCLFVCFGFPPVIIRLFKKEELKRINKSYSASLFSGFVQVVILYESLAFLNLFSECLDHSHFVRALRSLSVLGDLGQILVSLFPSVVSERSISALACSVNQYFPKGKWPILFYRDNDNQHQL